MSISEEFDYQSQKERLLSIVGDLEMGSVEIEKSLSMLTEATEIIKNLEKYISKAEATLKKVKKSNL